jgi:serine/threonine-protein kinase
LSTAKVVTPVPFGGVDGPGAGGPARPPPVPPLLDVELLVVVPELDVELLVVVPELDVELLVVEPPAPAELVVEPPTPPELVVEPLVVPELVVEPLVVVPEVLLVLPLVDPELLELDDAPPTPLLMTSVVLQPEASAQVSVATLDATTTRSRAIMKTSSSQTKPAQCTRSRARGSAEPTGARRSPSASGCEALARRRAVGRPKLGLRFAARPGAGVLRRSHRVRRGWMPFTAGQIVNGKYRVLRALGDGGMGSVYEAHHEVLGTRVALKLLHAELSRTGLAKRFLQEARASARIKSPHVVGVSDADQTPDGQAFIVLEYIEGRTLRERYEDLAREGKSLAYDDALELAMQLFEGIEAAHAAGIVHRDLKPDNLMITQDARGAPLLKVLDFGIAKVDESPESATPALTRPGALLGTPEYMAPEQVYSAGSADVRSDVFALGVILFEMLTGRRPVLSDDPQQIAVAYLTGDFKRLDEIRPDVPAQLAVAVHRAFAAQPRDRFPSVAEMRLAIEPFAPPRVLSTGRASQLALPAPSQQAANARASRPLPDTRGRPSNRPSAQPASGVPSSGAPAPLDTGAVATPAGTHVMSAGAAQPFAPDYPSAIAYSMVPPTPGPSRVPSSSAPDLRPSIVDPESRLPYGPPPALTLNEPAAQPINKHLVYGAIAAGLLLLAMGSTIGTLYYLGWFDPDPEPKAVRHAPPKPRPPPPPAPAPPPHHGGALR